METRDALVHQLKNFLTIVIGYSELLLEGTPPSDPRHADVVEILQAAKGMEALLNAGKTPDK